MRTTVLLAIAITLSAQQPPAPGGRGQGQGPPAPPGRGSASVRWENWSAMRSSAGTILGWQVGIGADAFRQTTLFNALEKTDQLTLGALEVSAAQKVNLEIPKPVSPTLAPGEITAVKDRMLALNVRIASYRVPAIGPGEDPARKLFDFARNIGISIVTVEHAPDSLPLIDKLANEYNVSVALCGTSASI